MLFISIVAAVARPCAGAGRGSHPGMVTNLRPATHYQTGSGEDLRMTNATVATAHGRQTGSLSPSRMQAR